MNKLPIKTHLLLMGLLLLLMLTVYWQTRSFDAVAAQRVHMSLEKIIRFDNQIEEGMLNFYIHRIRHFDDLAMYLDPLYTTKAVFNCG
jgi:hypothetical protein